MADLRQRCAAITDPLDAVGNTTKAVTKGCAIGSAVLAGSPVRRYTDGFAALAPPRRPFSLTDAVISGLIGGLLPFCSRRSHERGRYAGGAIVEESAASSARPGLMEGTCRPEYGRAIDIVTRSAIPAMISGAHPDAVPDPRPHPRLKMLGGLLVGTIVTGHFLAIPLTAGGGAWTNAKKSSRTAHTASRAPTHTTRVTGDTVGDPYKDTAGPVTTCLSRSPTRLRS